jgi:hypothetical protein
VAREENQMGRPSLNRIEETGGQDGPENAGVYGTGVEEEDTTSDVRVSRPLDPALIRVETRHLTLDLIITRVRQNEIDLAPKFQIRKSGIWNDGAQSRLIESLLIKIPLPVFCFDATREDRWLVVDGLQRLITFKRFVLDKELKLTGLEFLTKYDGMGFDELPRNLARRIYETPVTTYLIEKGTPPDVKFTIFKRLNTGGLPLSPQEIRYALNQGAATEMLGRLAGSVEFQKATAYGVSDTRMDDQECVLRFLAFSIVPFATYAKDDLDLFLNEVMERINDMESAERDRYEVRFYRAMNASFGIFGKDAFRKRYNEGDARKPVNKALFEVWSVNLDSLSDTELNLLEERKSILRDRFIELMNTKEFGNAVSQRTGDRKKVETRFRAIRQIIEEVLACSPS